MNPAKLLAYFDRVSDPPDAISRFRHLILDLAVRGKLVEQVETREDFHNDYINEPTSEELPANWRLLNFGKFCDIQGGNQPPKSQFLDEPRSGYVRLFQIRDLGESPVPTYIPEGSTNRFCRRGEILIGRYGASVGKIFWAQDGAYNVALAKFIYPQTAFVPQFAFLILKSSFFQAKLTGATRSAQAGFNKGDLADIDFPLPPLAEQHRIVAKVDELMALCDRLVSAQTERESRRDRLVASSLHHLNNGADAEAFREHARFYFNHLPRLTTRPDHIKQLRQTILNLAVRGKLVEQDPTDGSADALISLAKESKQRILSEWNYRPTKLFSEIAPNEMTINIPRNWRWERIGNIAAVKGGKRIPKGVAFSKERTPYVYIRVTDMQNQTVSTNKLKYIDEHTHKQLSRYVIEQEDIYIVIVGATIGKVGVIPLELNRMHLTENAAKLMFRNINKMFLLAVLQCEFIQAQFVEKTYQQAQPKLALERIESTVIPLPPLPEQHRIVAKVDELMALCDQLETQLTTTQSESRHLLEAILHEALANNPKGKD